MATTTIAPVHPIVRLAALVERVARLDYQLQEIVGELDVLADDFGAPLQNDPRVVELLDGTEGGGNGR